MDEYHIKHVMEAGQYRISGGTEYCWKCYGGNARYLDFHFDNKLYVHAIYDTQTQKTYQVNVSGDIADRFDYIWINPAYRDALEWEYGNRAIEFLVFDESTGERYSETETFEDILNKVASVSRGEVPDRTVVMTLDIPEDDLLAAFKIAHSLDITFNQYMDCVLCRAIDETAKIDPSHTMVADEPSPHRFCKSCGAQARDAGLRDLQRPCPRRSLIDPDYDCNY